MGCGTGINHVSSYFENMTDITFRVRMLEDDRSIRSMMSLWKINFVYNELSRKVSMSLENGYCMILKQLLNTVIGFGNNAECDLVNSFRNDERDFIHEDAKWLFIDDDKTTSHSVMDLHSGLHTFFVYRDIVEQQLVGYVNLPLIRRVVIKR